MLIAKVGPPGKDDSGWYRIVICGREGCLGKLPTFHGLAADRKPRTVGLFELDGWLDTAEGARRNPAHRPRNHPRLPDSRPRELDLPASVWCRKCGGRNMVLAEDLMSATTAKLKLLGYTVQGTRSTL